MNAQTATMIRHWINLHRGDCEAVARFMAYTLRIGGIGTCRQFVEYATAP